MEYKDVQLTRKTSEFTKRVFSAIPLAIAVLLIDYWGGWVFELAAALLGFVFYWEGLLILKVDKLRQYLGQFLYILLCLSVFAFVAGWLPLYAFYAWLAVLMCVLVVLSRKRMSALWLFFYSAAFALSLIVIRGDTPGGAIAVLYLLLVVWVSDSFAYFGGKLLKGPKLMPKISPNKTWSGALTGLFFSGLFGALFALTEDVPLLTSLLLGLVLSMIAQIGDIAESAFKRRYNVKDSGRIIPGHGGVMDRVDGLSLAAFCLALFVIARQKSGFAFEAMFLW